MTDNPYRDYTRTQALAGGVDEQALLAWSGGYFRSNFSRHLPADRGERILEVGCGYGRYVKTLGEMGYLACTGIDVSPEQVQHARQFLGLTNVEEADALAYLQGKEGAFDVILALDVLEHLDLAYLQRFGEAVRGALKPGGRLIVQVPNDLAPMNPFRHGDLTHVRAFTPTSINQFFLLSGLVTLEISEIPPHGSGMTGVFRRSAWALLLRPALKLFMLLAYGRTPWHGIHTGNLLAVGAKPGQPAAS